MSILRPRATRVAADFLVDVSMPGDERDVGIAKFNGREFSFQRQAHGTLVAYEKPPHKIFGKDVDSATFTAFQLSLDQLRGITGIGKLIEKLNSGTLTTGDVKIEFGEDIDEKSGRLKNEPTWPNFIAAYTKVAGTSQSTFDQALNLRHANELQIRNRGIELKDISPHEFARATIHTEKAGPAKDIAPHYDRTGYFLTEGSLIYFDYKGGFLSERNPLVFIREEIAGDSVASAVNLVIALRNASEARIGLVNDELLPKRLPKLTIQQLDPIARRYESILSAMEKQRVNNESTPQFATSFEHRIFLDATFGYIKTLMIEAAIQTRDERRAFLELAQKHIANLKTEKKDSYYFASEVLNQALASALNRAVEPLYDPITASNAQASEHLEFWVGLLKK
jgi:hypothetical protein